jgi:hypothetical protein
MPTDSSADPASNDPDALDNRLIIEILSWDWALHVGMAPDSVPQEQRHQGGLIYSRGLDINGRIVTPDALKGKTARFWISPVAPDIIFGPEGLPHVGQLHPRDEGGGPDLEATLFLPKDALPGVLTCLASAWKYLHIWTREPPPTTAGITDFAFSRHDT